MKGSNIMEQLYRAMRQSDDKWLYGLYLDERVHNKELLKLIEILKNIFQTFKLSETSGIIQLS